MKEEKIRTAFYGEKRLLELSDQYLRKADCRSRNEFINHAIKHYIAYLQKEDDNIFLTPALESVLSGIIGDTENRLARILFKLAVEMAMMLHVTASQSGISKEEIERLRGYCVNEVSSLNGQISFEKAYKYQKG